MGKEIQEWDIDCPVRGKQKGFDIILSDDDSREFEALYSEYCHAIEQKNHWLNRGTALREKLKAYRPEGANDVYLHTDVESYVLPKNGSVPKLKIQHGKVAPRNPSSLKSLPADVGIPNFLI